MEMIIYLINDWVPEVGNTANIPNPPWVIAPLKKIWESPWAKENLTSLGFQSISSMVLRTSFKSFFL